LHVHGRGASADVCGRSFAVLSTQVSKVGLRLRLVVPRPKPAAVASRCCRRRLQHLACAEAGVWQHPRSEPRRCRSRRRAARQMCSGAE
jgi:hypothetical protein